MTTRPNIVLILVDDMGYSDLTCFGGDIRTPRLDALAGNGLRYTHFYNSARCCPARAALLTGLYPHQAGMGWMTVADLGTDGYAGDLNDHCRTIAECLRVAGYSTYMSGKWHLTRDKFMSDAGPKHSWPLQRGFDRYWGLLSGGASYWTPHDLIYGNERLPAPDDPSFYLTDAIAEHACGFISDHKDRQPERPFFLYTAFTAPHWPLHARAEHIAKYRGQFRAGWDELRRRKFERMQAMGLLEPHWGLSERDPEVPAWDSLAKDKQDEFDLRMSIYAAQVSAMDAGVGRIVDTLSANGLFDNTLLLFLSDNGGCHEEIHRGQATLAQIGTDQSFESYGRPWANCSNTPFREFKSWVHEGGIATPLIAHWSAGLANKGALTRQVGHITDVMPTCLELAGAEYPKDARFFELAGQSLCPSFRGCTIGRKAIFWEHEGNRALRQGDWKVVAKGVEGRWELYDLAQDRSELHDLAAAHPARVAQMAGEWEATARRTLVYPLDGRGWHERIRQPIR
jgi:arylsulfatase A-like enzyme